MLWLRLKLADFEGLASRWLDTIRHFLLLVARGGLLLDVKLGDLLLDRRRRVQFVFNGRRLAGSLVNFDGCELAATEDQLIVEE